MVMVAISDRAYFPIKINDCPFFSTQSQRYLFQTDNQINLAVPSEKKNRWSFPCDQSDGYTTKLVRYKKGVLFLIRRHYSGERIEICIQSNSPKTLGQEVLVSIVPATSSCTVP